MKFDRDKHHRHSIRLRGFDYSQPSAYFITICTWQRECLFGDVRDGVMVLNDAGLVVQNIWGKLPDYYPGIFIDAFVIMPNHIHGILRIHDQYAHGPVGARFIAPSNGSGPILESRRGAIYRAHSARRANLGQDAILGQGAINRAPTVGDIIRLFKAKCTFGINALRQTRGTSVWQRNYWERIVRDDQEYRALCEYIKQNPAQWQQDSLYSSDERQQIAKS